MHCGGRIAGCIPVGSVTLSFQRFAGLSVGRVGPAHSRFFQNAREPEIRFGSRRSQIFTGHCPPLLPGGMDVGAHLVMVACGFLQGEPLLDAVPCQGVSPTVNSSAPPFIFLNQAISQNNARRFSMANDLAGNSEVVGVRKNGMLRIE